MACRRFDEATCRRKEHPTLSLNRIPRPAPCIIPPQSRPIRPRSARFFQNTTTMAQRPRKCVLVCGSSRRTMPSAMAKNKTLFPSPPVARAAPAIAPHRRRSRFLIHLPHKMSAPSATNANAATDTLLRTLRREALRRPARGLPSASRQPRRLEERENGREEESQPPDEYASMNADERGCSPGVQ